MRIGKVEIKTGKPPVFVAEIGANHDGSPEKVVEMLGELASRGVKIAKLQTYTSAELVADEDRLVSFGKDGGRQSSTIKELFDSVTLPKEAYRDLFSEANQLGVELFSTPFSLEGVDFLLEMGVGAFKLAASDLNYHDLVKECARSGLPLIMSCGKCTVPEIHEAVHVAEEAGCKELCLLHCVAEYPAPVAEMNLATIPYLNGAFPGKVIGLSDHSTTNTAAIVSTVLGASVIEKHVTYDKGAEGPDHWFSLDYSDVSCLLESLEETFGSMGIPRNGVLACEEQERKTSVRSLVAARDLKVGHRLGRSDFKVVRPGTGLAPKFAEIVEGMILQKDISVNHPLQWEDFK